MNPKLCAQLRLCAFILALLLLSSCAVHEPMSEMVMFAEKKTVDGERYHAAYSHAFASYSREPVPNSAVLEGYQNRNPQHPDVERAEPHQPLSLTYNFIFITEGIENFALSFSLPQLGFDVTNRISGPYYLTGAAAIAPNPQYNLILQRRFLPGNPLGLSAGITFGYKRRYVSLPGIFYGNLESYLTYSAGLRMVMMTAPLAGKAGHSLPFLHITTSVEYDFGLELIYPRIGATFGLY